MNTSIKLSLDTRRMKKDSTYPIIMRLSHFQKSTSIPTGLSIEKKFWDNDKAKVKNSYKGTHSVTLLNNQITKKKTQAIDIINKLAETDELDFLSLKQLKEKITSKKSYDSFFAFGEMLIEQMRQIEKVGNARSYEGTLRVLRTFNKNADLKINEINYDFLKSFERYHLSKEGNSYNGLAAYMRTIRAIFNKAIKAELIDKKAYPFDSYKIKQEPTQKRAIGKESLKKIIELDFEKGTGLFHARNYFILSYMLYGVSFVDFAFLKKKDIQNERLIYRRKKTAKIYDIKITPIIQEILDYYFETHADSEFIFPIVKRDDLELQYKDIQWARKRYNKTLKKIAQICEIEQKLTSYVSRHSFATQALLLEVPLAAISQMLGHTKLSTTQVYLKSLPNSILDDYQERINKF